MNPPQWPGQNPPPGQPGFPPPPGQPYGPPPGQPGFPPPPPPPSGSGPLVPLLLVGAVVVLALVAIGAFVVIGGDDGERRRVLPPPLTTPSYSPSTSTTTMDSVLKPIVSTAAGSTFTRAGTIRTGSCISRADSDLVTALRGNSCVDDMSSALYTNSSRTIVVVVSVLKFTDSTTAVSVNNATSRGANPTVLLPPTGSGLPALPRQPSVWNRSWAQGQYVVYAQGYNANGTDPGSRTGLVFTTAGELGREIANVMVWKG
ncbi:hypothetical protein GCM10009678_48100 [Actinomadura kijaniata]|uniref:Uncharacterized protein n=1 Tax=Actinomadura namibiensis TaxID=182080 RepID=A0A7W3QQE5_ACTNM|nr:hypothetical protein [Actinomadura namibiensis]MBA8955541.1 hypothetical protein [Actinomadura namibiensis]